MFIIFDTNIWFSQLGLNSHSGSSVRFYVQQCGATVAIPEVVRLELERNLTNHLQKLKNDIEKNHRELLTVFGTLKEISLPSDEQIKDKVSDLLTNIDVPKRDIHFSLEAARSSFLKTIEKLPPSQNAQQFKDGVIWAHCLELLDEGDVFLVSDDKAFYEDRKYEKGLASNLHSEADKHSNNFTIMPDLEKLLEEIRQEVQIDNDRLWEGVLAVSREEIQDILHETGFVPGGIPDTTAKLFTTEKTTQLYVKFEISRQCEDATNQGRENATLYIVGDGLYDTETQKCHGIHKSEIKLLYTDVEGQDQTKSIHFGQVHVTIGHKDVIHWVRQPLSE